MHVPVAADLGNVRGGDQGDHDTDGQDGWWQRFCKLWAQHWQMEPVLEQRCLDVWGQRGQSSLGSVYVRASEGARRTVEHVVNV